MSRPQHALIADRRATDVGDVITVLVMENSSASNSADTSTKTGMGLQGSVSGTDMSRHSRGLDLADNYGGRGQIQRSGRLVAQITTTVTQVTENGDLLIAGQQLININGEKTRIQLRGRVRGSDVADNNTVLSSRLADANIDYVGDGFITDRTRPGLIPRVLAWLGLW